MGVVGDELLLPSVSSALGLPRNLRLGQLDEEVATLIDPYTATVLAREVARCARGRWTRIVGLEMMVSFGDMSALELDLSTRACNHLLRLDQTSRGGGAEEVPLRDVTVSELALIPGFGAECLLEVLSVAKRVPSRLPPVVLSVAPPSSPSLPALTREVGHLRGRPLDQELEGIVDAVITSPRSRVAALARLGLEGRPPVTLAEAGRTVGVTPETVRQIEKRFHEAIAPALEAGGVWAPALEGALRAIRRTGLVTEEQLQARLSGRGLIPEGFSLGSVLAAGRVLGKSVEVYAEHGLISGPPVAVTPELIGEIAARSVSHWGATTIEDVRVLLTEETSLEVSARVATLLLETHKRLRWLDRRGGWFWLYPTRTNRLLAQIAKIMSVTSSISIRDLQDGIARHYHMSDLWLPRRVLARLCEDTGLYEQHDGRIHAKPGHPHWKQTLGENEAIIVEVLLDQGPVMPLADLQGIVLREKGVNPHTLTLYLGSSPVLVRHAPAVYGLRGTRSRRPRAR